MANQGKVRLADIAVAANVSIATVSRVLNGKEGVSQTVRQNVLATVESLGYERTALLSPKTRRLVGVVVPELTNPIFAEFATLIAATLTSHSYTPLICTLPPGGSTEDECLEAMELRGVCGIIFVAGMHADLSLAEDHYGTMIKAGIPVVLVNGYPTEPIAPSFSTDDTAAVDQAVSHLRQLGHHRIALVVGPRCFEPSVRRIAAFAAALGEPAADADIIETLFTIEGGHTAAVTAAQRGYTALVCASDLMAVGAIRGVRSLGLRVPEDVSVVGYDDCSLSVFFDPPLTTVRQPVAEITARAVSTLVRELEGVPGPRAEFLFRPEVVVRHSTAAAPHHG